MSMQKIDCLQAKQRSHLRPESFKACYVLGSYAINNEEGQYGEESSDPDHRHAQASRSGYRRGTRVVKEAGGSDSRRSGHPDHQAPQEGRAHPHRRSRHPAGAQARRPHGPQPRHRRSDPHQGQQEGCLPRGQGVEGSRLIGRVFLTLRHPGTAYAAPRDDASTATLASLSYPRFGLWLRFLNSSTPSPSASCAMWSSTPSRTPPPRPTHPPKSKKSWAPCSRVSCRRWALATPISTN